MRDYTRKRVTIWKILVFLLTINLPVSVIGLTLLQVTNGTMFTTPFVAIFIVLPIVDLILIMLICFSRIRAFFCYFLTIPINIAFIIAVVVGLVFFPYERMTMTANRDVSESYTAVTERYELMPDLDDLGDYRIAHHYSYSRNMIIADYSTNADSIVLQYEKDEYEMQKNKLSSRYFLEFEDDEIMFLDSVYRSSAVIGDYIFRILSTDDFYDEELEYPYTHMIIATNDKENKIAYIAYSMTDTESEAFAQFVLKDCGWTHILN